MSILEAFNPRERLSDETDIDKKQRRNYRAVYALAGAAAILMGVGKVSRDVINHELNSSPKIEHVGNTPQQRAEQLRQAYERLP